MVLGTDELYAIAHSQKLLALIYISGPQLVADYLLQSPVGDRPSVFFVSILSRIFVMMLSYQFLAFGIIALFL